MMVPMLHKATMLIEEAATNLTEMKFRTAPGTNPSSPQLRTAVHTTQKL